jgi:hypothetical protein
MSESLTSEQLNIVLSLLFGRACHYRAQARNPKELEDHSVLTKRQMSEASCESQTTSEYILKSPTTFASCFMETRIRLVDIVVARFVSILEERASFKYTAGSASVTATNLISIFMHQGQN